MPLKHPSNFELVVEAREEEDFRRAMEIAFDEDRYASHYKVKPGEMELLAYALDGETKELPYPMNCKTAVRFVWDWLVMQRPITKCPDIDGSVEPDGWRLEGGDWPLIARVTKVWSLYHK